MPRTKPLEILRNDRGIRSSRGGMGGWVGGWGQGWGFKGDSDGDRRNFGNGVEACREPSVLDATVVEATKSRDLNR